MRVYAAIITEVNGKRVKLPVFARKHNYHRSPDAAERALERLGKRGIEGQGIVWPCGTDGGDVKNWIKTIAL